MNHLDYSRLARRSWVYKSFKLSKIQFGTLGEPDLHVRPLFEMYALDEAHFPGSQGHDDRGCARALAEEAHAFHQSAVGYAGGGKDQLLARREVFGFVDSILVFNPHAFEAFFLIGLYDQASEHIAVEAAHGRSSNYAFGR